MLRYLLPLVALISYIVSEAAAEPLPKHNKYNVLFIAIDDLRPELGCYGVSEAQSPHLDHFASEAVLFNRHYVQVATCGASRYALITGRSPVHTGVTKGNAAAYQGPTAFSSDQLPGAQTLPEMFRRSGYRTTCIGKISHTADGRVFSYDGKGDGRHELPLAWDELATPLGQWERGWGIFFAYAGGHHREDGQGHLDLMEFTAKDDEDLPDGLLAKEAIEKLHNYKETGDPFFMGLGFFKPHLPFVAPQQDWDAFEGIDLTSPKAIKPDSPWWTSSGEFFKYDTPYEKTRPLSSESRAMARRAYLACVRYADRQVGRVLNALEELGLDDNTVVVIWGDHGWHLGEQQMWGKHSPFERSNRSVLIVRAPGISQPGLVSNALIETTDIYPTLMDICDPEFSKTQHPLTGASFKDVLSGKKESIRDTATSYWGRAVSVRNDSHRLIVKVDPRKGIEKESIELHDLSSDQDETTNVAQAHPEIVETLLSKVPKQP